MVDVYLAYRSGHTAAMTVVGTARRTARRVRRSTVLEVLTRAGFVGYGLLHLAVGWLALQIARGRATEEGDQSGAFRILLRQPFGRALLVVIIVGLVAMAVWQLLEAAVGHRTEHGWERVGERVLSLARTAVYAALAWTAGKVLAGARLSSAQQQEHTVAGILGGPLGRGLVLAGGVAVIAIGLGMLYYGLRRKFERRLRISQMRARARRIACRLGQLGYGAKGIAFAIVGLLLAAAALHDSAAESRGLDYALRTLAGEPLGTFLLYVIAAGFAAFGVYCFFQSRYRKV